VRKCTTVLSRQTFFDRLSVDFKFAHVTHDRGAVLLWRRCDTLCTSGFAHDVVYKHDSQEKGDAKKVYTQSDSTGASTDLTPPRMLKPTHQGPQRTGAESDICDCRVLWAVSELSVGWVDPWVGLGCVEIFQFLVGWVYYSKSTKNLVSKRLVD